MSNINLSELELTKDELDRFTQAFRNEEFKKLFANYCEEISDPANKKLFEQELTQLEAERGIDVTFINPEPGYVIKTSANGAEKIFINVSQCDKIGKPTSKRDVDASGKRGLVWSIPHAQSPPRKDVDNKGTLCSVYDVVFHPDALHLAQKDVRFKKLVTDTACQAVQSAFSVNIDLVNLKFPKLAFKGAVKPTVIRKQSTNPPTDYEPSPIDQIYPPVKHLANSKAAPVPVKHSAVANYATPKYQIVHRRDVELHELTNELDARINVTIPKELVVNIDLPLLSSTNEVTLDVTDRKIYLVSEKPAKYKLNIDLPFDVSEKDGNAKFDKKNRKLVITLPVIRKRKIVIGDFCREDSGVESDQISSKDGNSVSSNEDASSDKNSNDGLDDITDKVFNDINANVNEFFDSAITYELPSFTCNSLDNNVAFTLNVKNVDPESIVMDRECETIQMKFTSIGAGYFPINYAFCVKFPPTCGAIIDAQPDAWDNNLILQLELENVNFDSYWTGANLGSMQEHAFKHDPTTVTVVSQKSEKSTDYDVDVSVVSEKEVKIEITSVDNAKDDTPTVVVDSQKKNKRKKKKQRSLSESHCDDLKEAINETNNLTGPKPATKSIDINKSPGKVRSISESSNDEQVVPKVREFKSILKRRSSYNRSISESSVDDHIYSCSMDIGVGSIPEESGAEMSESCKKTVRFDNNVQKLLFKMRSTILGQRKPKTNKRKKKKGTAQRRYSEGEASDYDESSKTDTEITKDKAADKSKIVPEQRDSGVDFGDSGDENKKSNAMSGKSSRHYNSKASKKEADLEMEFKSGMMFDIEM